MLCDRFILQRSTPTPFLAFWISGSLPPPNKNINFDKFKRKIETFKKIFSSQTFGGHFHIRSQSKNLGGGADSATYMLAPKKELNIFWVKTFRISYIFFEFHGFCPAGGALQHSI